MRFKHYFKMDHSSIWDPLVFARWVLGPMSKAIQPEKPYCNLINSGCSRYASFLDCPATPLAVRGSGYQLSRLAFLGFDSVLRLPMAITRLSDVFSNFPLLNLTWSTIAAGQLYGKRQLVDICKAFNY